MKKRFLILLMSSILSASAIWANNHPTNLKDYPITGTLYPLHSTTISSQVPGRVIEMLAEIGDSVEKGQVLAKIDPLFFEIEFAKQQTAVDLAKISYEEAELNYLRMKNLWEKKEGERASISKKQLDDAKWVFKQKKLLLEQAIVELEFYKRRLEETVIKAPYSGVITKRFVDPGEAVLAAPVVAILQVMDLSQMILEFSLPQELLPVIVPGLAVKTQLENGQWIEAKIEKVLPEINILNRSFKCRILLDNHEMKLKPGASMRVTIQTLQN